MPIALVPQNPMRHKHGTVLKVARHKVTFEDVSVTEVNYFSKN
jgi:hypothetical protein